MPCPVQGKKASARNFSNRGLLNDPADQGPRLGRSKTRAISESKEKKGIHVLSEGENMLFFLKTR